MRHAGYFDEAAVSSRPRAVSDLVVGGAGAGSLAGAAMLLWATVSAAFLDLSPAHPLELTGATFIGSEALDGVPAMLYGLLLWAVVSAALGIVYAALIPRDFPFDGAALLGVGYSFVVLAMMTSVVLPGVNPDLHAELPAMGGSWVIAYVVFGVLLGLAPVLRRSAARRGRAPFGA